MLMGPLMMTDRMRVLEVEAGESAIQCRAISDVRAACVCRRGLSRKWMKKRRKR